MDLQSIIITILKHFTAVGIVTISPAHTASVCRGDQLELICNTTGAFLEWRLCLISDGETTARKIIFIRIVTIFGQVPPLLVNSTVFNFSRIPAENTLPLTSRLLISPVSNNLNGTEVNCTNLETSETASTVVSIINKDLITGRLQEVIKITIAMQS